MDGGKFPGKPFLGNLATGRCVGPSFRVRNDMAESFEKWSMLRACRRTFCGQPGSKPRNRTRRRCNGFLLNVPCVSHLPSVTWRMEERTDLSSARWVTNKLEERGHMSSQNGDKARFNRLRKQKFRRRELMARLATQSAASAARLGKTPPAKLAQR